MSLNFGQFWLQTLSVQKYPIDLKWGKWCLHFFSVVFLLENYSKYFDDFTCRLSGERSFPYRAACFLNGTYSTFVKEDI